MQTNRRLFDEPAENVDEYPELFSAGLAENGDTPSSALMRQRGRHAAKAGAANRGYSSNHTTDAAASAA
jgi:hypothetical protein